MICNNAVSSKALCDRVIGLILDCLMTFTAFNFSSFGESDSWIIKSMSIFSPSETE